MLQNQNWTEFNCINESHFQELVLLFNCNIFYNPSAFYPFFCLEKKMIIDPKLLSDLFSSHDEEKW